MSEQEALCDDRLADRIDALAGAASMCDSPEALELLRDNLLDLARNVRTTRPPAAPVSDAKEWRVGILRPDLLEDDPPSVSDAMVEADVEGIELEVTAALAEVRVGHIPSQAGLERLAGKVAALAAPVSDAEVEAAAKALWDENEAQEVAATDAGHYDRRRGSYKPIPWSAADEYDRPEYLARARNALAAARAVSGEDTGDE